MAKKTKAPQLTPRQQAAANRIRIGGRFVNRAAADAATIAARANGVWGNAQDVNRYIQQNERDIREKVFGWKELTGLEAATVTGLVENASKIFDQDSQISVAQAKLNIATFYNIVSSRTNTVNIKMAAKVNTVGHVFFDIPFEDFFKEAADSEGEDEDFEEYLNRFAEQYDILLTDSPLKGKKK